MANTHLVKKLMKLASSHEWAVGPEMDLCKSAGGLRSGKMTDCGQADGHNEYLFESVNNRPLRSARTIHDLGMRISRQRYIHYSSKDCKANTITVHGCVNTRFRCRKSFPPVYSSNTCSLRYRQSRIASSDCRQSPMHGRWPDPESAPGVRGLVF